VDLNKEFVISKIRDSGHYYVKVATTSTSAAAGGGAGVTVQYEITAGADDASVGRGYGMGKYGVGRWGVSKTSSAGTLTLPRIWSFAQYGQKVLCCPGNTGTVYTFTGQTTTAPAATTNAPTADYIFETNNHIVVLNAGGTQGKVQWNNGTSGDETDWTAGATSSAGNQTILGLGALKSHSRAANGVNILFGENGWKPMKWQGGAFPFDFNRPIENNQTLMAQNARAEFNGLSFFVGEKDIFQTDGVIAKSLGGNTGAGEIPVKKYFFDSLNRSQQSKVTCRVDEKGQRLYISFPADGNTELSKTIYFSIRDGHWGIGLPVYTAYEYPSRIFDRPYACASDGTLYQLNNGVNDDGSGMSWSFTSNFFQLGDGSQLMELQRVILDAVTDGNYTVTVNVKDEPNSDPMIFGPYDVSDLDEYVDIWAQGRYAQVVLAGSDVDLSWRKGAMKIEMEAVTEA
jgi:hypothetical protein